MDTGEEGLMTENSQMGKGTAKIATEAGKGSAGRGSREGEK